MAIHTFCTYIRNPNLHSSPTIFFLRLLDNFWGLRRPNIIGTPIEPGLPSSTSFHVQVPLDCTQRPAMKIQKPADEITEPLYSSPPTPTIQRYREEKQQRRESFGGQEEESETRSHHIRDTVNRYRYGEEEAPADGSEQPY